MEHIAIGLTILQMFALSFQITIRPSKDLAAPSSSPTHESMEAKMSKIQEYIQNKILNQHQALELLVQLSKANEVLTKKLMKHCFLERPKTPDKFEILLPNRRSNANYDQRFDEDYTNREENIEEDMPIVSMIKFGRRMPTLGRLFLDVISDEFSQQIEPVLKVLSSTEANNI